MLNLVLEWIKLPRRMTMKELYIKQKVFSIGEKFTVTDEYQNDVYYVEGSFFQIPKTFSI